MASGVNNAVARTGGLLAVATIPPLAGLTGDAFDSPAIFTTGFHTTRLVSASMMGLAALLTFLTIRENVLIRSEPKTGCPVTAPQPGR
ncbi:hypothetical protein OIE13_09240 [Streptosporangium sp. NBC_01810]|uniref:hypothetical protein n=1 Tax=Streptosporangium sp. NBC_01810 TaxID=2975951 RepID=UPI002DD7DEC1|nr:hypothetical protein [Streptosporangium sp. NBC_01810]WSA28028.1 hypothetical protein OIE13_09240 [Streptosporangium sp. NBC_01810]